jgi:5'-nucleotidase / UDP-sugar diphosphatase
VKTFPRVTLALFCALATGCAAKKNEAGSKVPLDRGVTDISPTSAPTSIKPPDPSYVTPGSPAQPHFVPADMPVVPAGDATAAAMAMPAPAAPVAAAPPAPAPAPAVTQTPALPAARQYKVQKGDTLFGIARTHYGTGGRWQQIASANPGLTPATPKAGTTIVVP